MPRPLGAAQVSRGGQALLVPVYKRALRFGEGRIGEKWEKIALGYMLGRAALKSNKRVCFLPRNSCPFPARRSTIERPSAAGARGCIMSTAKVALLLHQIRRMATEPTSPDGVLLERFARNADEAA